MKLVISLSTDALYPAAIGYIFSRIASSVSCLVAPPAIRPAVSDASPSLPFGSAADPLLIQMLKATNGEFGSGREMVSASAAKGVQPFRAAPPDIVMVSVRTSAGSWKLAAGSFIIVIPPAPS